MEIQCTIDGNGQILNIDLKMMPGNHCRNRQLMRFNNIFSQLNLWYIATVSWMLDDIGKPTTSLVVDFLFVDFTDSAVV